MSAARKYLVASTYRITGSAVIVARSAAEAARIGRDGYPDGTEPQFDFSDPHSETLMRAERVPDHWAPAEVRDGSRVRPFVSSESIDPSSGSTDA